MTYKRELKIDGKAYVPKGNRKGQEISWKALVSGEAALAVALNASLKQVRS
jgi:hypothetical protein